MQKGRALKKPETQSTDLSVNKENAALKIPVKEKVVELFSEFADVLIAKKRTSLAAFFKDPLLHLESEQITITVGSKLVVNEINEISAQLVSFFEQKGYKILPLLCHVNAVEVSEYKVFTPSQQFDVMAKEFPMLVEFKTRFNLEFNE